MTREIRLRAAAADLAAALPMLAAAALIAVAWLLARTAAGRDDASSLDSAVAIAIAGTVAPAWLARLALSLVSRRATPGQHARGLRLATARAGETRWLLLRLAAHPFGAAGWAWAAAVLGLAHLYAAAAALGLLAMLVAGAGLVSLALVLAAPGGRALHDRIAGTRLVRA